MDIEERLEALETRIAALEAGRPLAPATIDPDALYPIRAIVEAGWLGSSTTTYKLVQRREIPSVALGPRGGCLRVRGSDILAYHRARTTTTPIRGRKLTHIR